MRRGFSPTRARVNEELAQRRQRDSSDRSRSSSQRREGESSRIHPTNPSINHWKYFCHYNNAVYQGSMSAYKKHGRGLLLHDDGAAVVTEYLHDTPTGHNIIFRDNSIASVLFKSPGEYEIAYKVGKCILKVGFADGSETAHGLGVLIDYQALKIYRLTFRKGAIIDKALLLDRRHNEDAFKRNSIAKLMGLKHEEAFSLTFEKPETMQVKATGNELTVGYLDKEGQLHGLAFRMYCQNVEVSGNRSLYLKSIERGYYKRSQLETYGEKFFSNGNKYVGEFQKGQFHGRGILVCPQEMKWVYGKFTQGKLAEVIDSNSKRYTENEFQMWTNGLLEIHKRYRERWIDFNIQLPDELYLYTLLKDVLKKQVTEVDPDHEEVARQDEYRMNRIQQQFQEGLPGNIDRSYVDVQLEKHYSGRPSKSSRIIDTPKSKLREQPRGREQVRGREQIKNKPAIYIDDPKRQIGRIEQTPISKIESKNTPKMASSGKRQESRQGERHHREQDPFKIELMEVPMEHIRRQVNSSPPRKQRDPIKVEDEFRSTPEKTSYKPIKVSPKQPIRQTLRDPLRDSSRDRLRAPLRQSIRQPLRYSEEIPRYFDEGIYRRTYLKELERQRELYRRLEREDEEYINYLRRGISRSPVHRDYYNTPPRYDTSSKRYNGRIINKKNFNYQEGSPPRTREEPRDAYTPKVSSPSRLTGNSPYRGSPSNLDSLSSSRSFIENNYKHWR